jgi:hypothetical protein
LYAHYPLTTELKRSYTVTDNIAVLDGYTEEVYVEHAGTILHLLVVPDTDLADRFKAWDMDYQEYVHVNGWLADEIHYC